MAMKLKHWTVRTIQYVVSIRNKFVVNSFTGRYSTVWIVATVVYFRKSMVRTVVRSVRLFSQVGDSIWYSRKFNTYSYLYNDLWSFARPKYKLTFIRETIAFVVSLWIISTQLNNGQVFPTDGKNCQLDPCTRFSPILLLLLLLLLLWLQKPMLIVITNCTVYRMYHSLLIHTVVGSF